MVPDLDAGNILFKQLQYLAGALAGVVVGARVSIVLTSRADGELARMASWGGSIRLRNNDGPGALPRPSR